jgi:hypothetical protein
MSDFERMAAAITPPRMGDIRAMDVTTAAGAATDTGVSTPGPKYVTFQCDVACYITFSNDGLSTNITDPDDAAVTGDGRTWRIPADQPTPFLVSVTERYFKPRGSDTGVLRWYISSR